MMLSLYKVSQYPLIFHCYNFGNIFSPIKQLAPYIQKGKNIHFVLTLNWSIRPKHKIESFAKSYHYHARKYPWLIVTVLANEPEELTLLKEHGIRSELCNQNCLLDEHSYTIHDVEKRYDAISNSRMAPYKRLELLRDVKNCALITYFMDASDYDYGKRILPPPPRRKKTSCLPQPYLPSVRWKQVDTV